MPSSAARTTSARMDLASRRLRDTSDSLDAIARSVGYTSVYAFSRAFSRARGQSPGRYRVTSRHGTLLDEPAPGQLPYQ
jgi:AraC-like DNA-binding protein